MSFWKAIEILLLPASRLHEGETRFGKLWN